MRNWNTRSSQQRKTTRPGEKLGYLISQRTNQTTVRMQDGSAPQEFWQICPVGQLQSAQSETPPNSIELLCKERLHGPSA